MGSTAAAKRYHHGELRSALIAAALVLLERDGPAALTLRGLARAVGVSPMAPYHHFADRAQLLAAVAAAGFERLQARKLSAQAEAPGSPRQALIAGTASYVAFVLEHPKLYRLMKGPDFAETGQYPDLQRAAAAPAGALLGLITQLLEPQDNTRLSAPDCAKMLWGLAHGIGTLALDGQIDPASADHLARQGAAAMIDGWLSVSPRRE